MLISQFIIVIVTVIVTVIVIIVVTVIVIITFLIRIFTYSHGLYKILNPSLIA